jgi:hypothetical protein
MCGAAGDRVAQDQGGGAGSLPRAAGGAQGERMAEGGVTRAALRPGRCRDLPEYLAGGRPGYGRSGWRCGDLSLDDD